MGNKILRLGSALVRQLLLELPGLVLDSGLDLVNLLLLQLLVLVVGSVRRSHLLLRLEVVLDNLLLPQLQVLDLGLVISLQLLQVGLDSNLRLPLLVSVSKVIRDSGLNQLKLVDSGQRLVRTTLRQLLLVLDSRQLLLALGSLPRLLRRQDLDQRLEVLQLVILGLVVTIQRQVPLVALVPTIRQSLLVQLQHQRLLVDCLALLNQPPRLVDYLDLPSQLLLVHPNR